MPDKGSNSIPDTTHQAEGPQVPAATIPHIRALAQPFRKSQLIQNEDGSLLIKGVPMLASGTWTDSTVQTALYYPEKTLKEFATNWTDTTGWSRHLGGAPRDITDKVAEATNLRFENGAVVSDVLVYGATQKSRDLQELVRRKLINFVSVEHTGEEKYNVETRQMEAATLNFHGFAFVNRGACKVCRINETPSPEPVIEQDACEFTERESGPTEQTTEPYREESSPEQEPGNMADFDKDAFKADLIKELSAIIKPAEPAKAEIPKELSDSITALAARIEKIEQTPAPSPVVTTVKELGEVEVVAFVNKAEGTVRGA
jgi:hypothetical protein